ncbi:MULTISPECIES: gluconate 2-dehydrogenase subunit 3 family protein [Hymenobacter]|uniref:Gluconate 2-dehydrogenase subunit 3 family protein n=1 Tax=Hymenobacter jejuensis TaxID=2502781 RepID=A0A5B8A2G3_9BACT|nr:MULTISPECIES: gluconate 2-dehydrogenase subunit 3 family protein [Hymenobacter]MBC6989563.1 gluconate 2-dehydrogenase subunit 3 family protein [Hymenobacter sp. BT491]QDA61581.1 gluconate 2-dehydrogenase subunit 3 family protein [Hymenobacter jejuensis]
MNRRDALARVAILMGGTVIGADYFLSSCSSPTKEKTKEGKEVAKTSDKPFLNQDQVRLMDEVADTILPTTAKSPGAKAAQVGSFMAVMVRDCYTPADQKIFLNGITQLDKDCKKQTGKTFLECTPAQRTTFLTALDKEQKEFTANQRKDDPSHYFRMMKQLTLLGYFTSEVGATKALRYLPVPGRYDGDVPYKKGDRAWATT